MNAQDISNVSMSQNVIIVDADYADHVAFQLIVQFERMIGRAIPPADLSRWAVNVALDGGLREDGGPHETQLVLVYDHCSRRLENFTPADYEAELNARAFRDDRLGEFLVNAVPVGEMVSKDDYLLDFIGTMAAHKDVRRLMIIPNGEQGTICDEIRHLLRQAPDDKRITLFAMQPLPGGNFRQEILGYSLMNAMGIRGEEISGQPE